MDTSKNPLMFDHEASPQKDLNVNKPVLTFVDVSSPETVTVILPIPPRRLSPNCSFATRGGRFAKMAATRKYRTLAKEAVEAACVESGPWERAVATVTFYWPDNRRRDEDNAVASLKAAYDGLVEAGLVVDDDSRHLRREMPIFAVDKAHPRVEMVIERREE